MARLADPGCFPPGFYPGKKLDKTAVAEILSSSINTADIAVNPKMLALRARLEAQAAGRVAAARETAELRRMCVAEAESKLEARAHQEFLVREAQVECTEGGVGVEWGAGVGGYICMHATLLCQLPDPSHVSANGTQIKAALEAAEAEARRAAEAAEMAAAVAAAENEKRLKIEELQVCLPACIRACLSLFPVHNFFDPPPTTHQNPHPAVDARSGGGTPNCWRLRPAAPRASQRRRR